jgi:hypothetical protein
MTENTMTATFGRAMSPNAPEVAATRTLCTDLAALRGRIETAVADRPIAATAAAAGVGFVLGGGITRTTMSVLMQTAVGLTASWLQRTVRDRDPDRETVGVPVEEDRR